MASQQKTVDFILEQVGQAGNVSAKKMFGEYGIFCDGKMVGLVCDDQLFVKPTAGGKEFIGTYVEGIPYPGSKPHLLISGELWEDQEWLSQLFRISANEIPLPNKKPRTRTR